ncbi:MAG TPA: 5-oxoprolinase subunit PxpA [Dokdonella sp.]|uniref:5-oxoprolinase subunit PxpA n=1 Tax=Dokdonella sp. TaxID=2291710 RepID=UPI002D7EDC4C|nr:5-oxoprolinase subunit PxpA [Dokdonella sp.]HET9032355.1 5-oxoprolinase subunit PxpA [Dokdonella sp.]
MAAIDRPRRIDFNCDLGEGCGNDAAIMPWISSANIACGAHAGDETSMRETLRLCRESGVAAGAHPGYADREHFGRRVLQLEPAEVAEQIRQQLQRLSALAEAEGVGLVHVKPHGALYNQAANDGQLADTIATVVRDFDDQLILVGLADSELPRAGVRAGLQVAHEAFADRRYLADASLAPRGTPGAVIEDVDVAVAQALSIVNAGHVDTLDGERIRIRCDTLCLHGDRHDAVDFARRLRSAFAAAGVHIDPLDQRSSGLTSSSIIGT